MVKRLSVFKLYGTYDYTLPFEGDRSQICFISGPNGYGKTSILTLLDATLTENFDVLLNPSLDYDKFEVELDSHIISVIRTKINQAPIEQDEVDYLVTLNIEVLNPIDNSVKESSCVTTETASSGNASYPASISLYLHSLSCHYLHDDRLFAGNASAEENIMNVYDQIATKMSDFDHETNLSLDFVRTMFRDNMSKPTPLAVKPSDVEMTKKLLCRYHNVGLITSLSLENVTPTDPLFLSASQVLEETPFLLQMEAFKRWIDDSCFSHKHLTLDIQNGAMFVTDNDELLLPTSLSSGEKQHYMQAYQLTIGASRGAIVLIDEPEMSYHPAWLTDYYEHIVLAARSQNLQIILATHSLAIFGYDEARSIDLYTLANEDVNAQ